ncbi:diiron oxygenase [Streptomyces gilvosporeus]|uniref:diiron oxygenase n=1 Tax=Streptomyces gilvosporeus TaxID=553510 RepID=UPI001F456245|nr:diiron oxygenase [Streptomyces gilvosporeus]
MNPGNPENSANSENPENPENPENSAEEVTYFAAEDGINYETLQRVSAAWPRRATIAADSATPFMTYMPGTDEAVGYDPAVPDYPIQFLPFAEHPDFLAGTPEQIQLALTLAWLIYNERVITAEEFVANPTFSRLAHGDFPGTDRFEIKQAVQQAHVDETWHTYMHMMAMQRTRELRAVRDEPNYPHAITFRALTAAQDQVAEKWHKDLLALVWTAVSEISVNAYLELLSRDETIQPMHALVTRLHSRDESAHSPVMFEVSKSVYTELDAEQRQAFDAAVPRALHAFVAQDYAVWPAVLERCGYRNAVDIVEECRSLPGNGLLVRDFTGVERLIRYMGLDISLAEVTG